MCKMFDTMGDEMTMTVASEVCEDKVANVGKLGMS